MLININVISEKWNFRSANSRNEAAISLCFRWLPPSIITLAVLMIVNLRSSRIAADLPFFSSEFIIGFMFGYSSSKSLQIYKWK